MKKRGLEYPPRRYRQNNALRHGGRIGAGPKPNPKRAVNVSIDAEVLEVAKDLGVNLSQTLEDALCKLTEEERIRRWQDEHRSFFETYNTYLKRNGTLSEAVLDLDDPAV